ncbi:MAG: tetraacyldisaccharide 4'-kinase [Candidatus Methylomirabilis oxyfera]|nr:tetraacyldisaccharide 4'-kinase [Candidatus Methylomirabilis oxyfera]
MRATEGLSAWTVRCMGADRATWAARSWLAFLRLASYVYGGLVSVRAVLFARGLTGVRRLPVPVLSVGNLIAGGTGKTPFVEMLAHRLQKQGHRVAIVLRGYRGRSTTPMIISDGRGLLCEPPVAADEAYLLARHLPGVAVLTGADRYRVGQVAWEQLKCGVIVLDDGFQHLRLYRDLDIVLLDAANPMGYGRLLPSGLLRERPKGLARAHLLVLTHADSVSDLDPIKRSLRRYAPSAPIALAVHKPLGLTGPCGEKRLPPSELMGQRVVAFSGIANPRGFETTLVRLGAVVLAHRAFPDHYAYSAADLESLSVSAMKAHASFMVTTEKDMVKLTRLNLEKMVTPLYGLAIALEMLEGEEALDRMLTGLLGASAL